jgi:hypothetical protein
MRIKYKILDLEKEIRCEKKGIFFFKIKLQICIKKLETKLENKT